MIQQFKVIECLCSFMVGQTAEWGTVITETNRENKPWQKKQKEC